MNHKIHRFTFSIFIIPFLFFCFGKSVFTQPYLKKIKNGQHMVGFRSFHIYDSSRPSIANQKDKKTGRMLQVNVWYPSNNQSKNTLTFKNYIYLKKKESTTEETTETQKQNAIKEYFQWAVAGGTSQKEIDAFFEKDLKMMASKNSLPKNKKYPVVLLMHGSAVDYAFLGEFLAGHGFISINVPTKGYLQKSLDVSGLGMETQIRDYEFTLTKVSSAFNVDTENTFAIGFSFGGQSAVGFMMRNPNTQAVISLDGGIGSKFGARLIRNSPFYNLTQINKPILHLYNPKDRYTDLTAIKGYVFANRLLAGFEKMEHGHFVSFGMLSQFIKIKFNQKETSPSGFEAIMQITLNFLKAHLKREGEKKNIKQKNNLVPWMENLISKYEFFEKIK